MRKQVKINAMKLFVEIYRLQVAANIDLYMKQELYLVPAPALLGTMVRA